MCFSLLSAVISLLHTGGGQCYSSLTIAIRSSGWFDVAYFTQLEMVLDSKGIKAEHSSAKSQHKRKKIKQ
jgi:hypothetical protein